MDPNQIIQMMQAGGMQLPSNALQLIAQWQQNRPASFPNWQPGQWRQNFQQRFANITPGMGGPFGFQYPVMPMGYGAGPSGPAKGGGVGRTMTPPNASYTPMS